MPPRLNRLLFLCCFAAIAAQAQVSQDTASEQDCDGPLFKAMGYKIGEAKILYGNLGWGLATRMFFSGTKETINELDELSDAQKAQWREYERKYYALEECD